MTDPTPKPTAKAAVIEHADWNMALRQALIQTGGPERSVDLAVLFASASYAEHFPELVRRAKRETGAKFLIGCSGGGVIGPAREVENTPALALLTLSLPGATLRPARFTQELVVSCDDEAWRECLDTAPDAVNAWLIFVDPFRLDGQGLIDGLAGAYPDRPMLGGMASAGPMDRRTWVFLDEEVYDEGGVGLAIGGPYDVLPLVSQGCEPIGETWTITGAEGNRIQSISNRPAVQVLADTLRSLPDDLQERAGRNLLVGLAADEYRHDFGRGDFVIRGLMGIDQRTGDLLVGAQPRIGQTIQFQMRDAAAADVDLHELLDQTRTTLSNRTPIAGILCSCNGRGAGLFGAPDHDAAAVAGRLGALPLAGLFCNGEIGPIGTRPFLHGFTASLALIVQDA